MSNHQSEKQSFLYRLRHSLAHILAQAVLEIRPAAKLAFGPPVDDGFYYDFDFADEPLSDAAFKDLEKRMKKIIRQKQEFSRKETPFSDAAVFLREAGQTYKIEYASELVDSGRAENGVLSFYENGPFIDMCEGPHLDHTGLVPKGCFKLDRISGSYWRGDEKRPMLTRIYGLAFETPDELKSHIERRELARQRDHRKLGRDLEIFLIDEEVGVGLPMWLPNGTVIRDELEKWAREEEFLGGYQRVSTPVLTRGELYHRSGHLPYYAESMFPPMIVDEHDEYYLRPMNCPHHHKIYASRPRSYRDLPIRLAEFGDDFRYEKHGSLSGLLRVRAMCQNDAHIYCQPSQVEAEFTSVLDLYQKYYNHLRLGNFRVRLSLHDAESGKFIEDEEGWTETERIVRSVLQAAGISFDEEIGEAAFYGPKMDIQITNLLGREETISTCQLDFLMARRFDLTYTASDGTLARPYIIHRAPLGTHERTVSFLIESYGGAFPTWLAPVQVALIPIAADCVPYAREIEQAFTSRFIRASVDESSDTFNKRIRKAVTQKIPNLWILGNDEVSTRTVTWRRYCLKEQQKIDLDRAVRAVEHHISRRLMDNFSDVPITEDA